MNLRVAGFDIDLRGELVKEVKYILRFKTYISDEMMANIE